MKVKTVQSNEATFKPFTLVIDMETQLEANLLAGFLFWNSTLPKVYKKEFAQELSDSDISKLGAMMGTLSSAISNASVAR